ncbi:MFS transporter [Streptomyces tagetis]|uniref:MFS transporter n=1 Tax=Streptomyces tagetis TaxID=2820809 RepID=A0A941AY71_9ACTN|nr:MFS transporter [Streptomyces sp. RG38]MBQ0827079.1 MFS transporter [Streptomyces sp. RG38]
MTGGLTRRYPLTAYLTGAVAARAGDEMSGPALLLAGFALSGSAAEASSLLAAVTVAAAAGGPVIGALLDSASRPGRLLAVALLLYAAGVTGVLAALGRLPFALTLLIAVVTGLLGPALSGGWTAQLPRVVPGGRLPRANALDAMSFGVASLAGPALAGVVAEAAGAPAAVGVSAALIALAIPAAWCLPRRETGTGTGTGARDGGRGAGGPLREGTASSRPRRPGASSHGRAARGVAGRGVAGRGIAARGAGLLTAGFRVVARSPPLGRATLTSVICCVAQGMFTACVPLLGERALGSAGRGALLFACAALSALVANALFARYADAVAPDGVVRAGALVQGAGFALAATGGPAALVAAAIVVGAGEGPQLTALFAVRHREAPAASRGQVFTTGASLKITGFAAGAALAGPLATRSLPTALVSAAGIAVASALAPVLVPAGGRRRRPEAPDGGPVLRNFRKECEK